MRRTTDPGRSIIARFGGCFLPDRVGAWVWPGDRP